MEAQRSPFIIYKAELLVAISTFIVTGFGLHNALWNSYPVGYFVTLHPPLVNFIIVGREEIFRAWVLPISIILTLSSIFLVRGIANQQIQHFSRLNHFALAWPLVLFPSVTYLHPFGLCCFPFGLVLSFLSLVESNKSRKWWGSLLAIVWNVVCVIIAGYYFGHLDYIFGD